MGDYQLQATIYREEGAQPERTLLSVEELTATLAQGDFSTLVLYEGDLHLGQYPHGEIAMSRESAKRYARSEDFGTRVTDLLAEQNILVVSDEDSAFELSEGAPKRHKIAINGANVGVTDLLARQIMSAMSGEKH